MAWFGKLFRRSVPVKHTITGKNNPYKARIQWPPDFSKLPFKQQFRFEKKYRRRSKMKHMNETWVKSVKIYQWVACTSFAVWALLFYDWPMEDNHVGEPPFWTLRQFVFGEYAAIWTTAPEGWRPTPIIQPQTVDSNESKESEA